MARLPVLLTALLTIAAVPVAAACSDDGSSGPTINTSSGSFTVARVEEPDFFPPHCKELDLQRGCTAAKEGFKLLVVWLEASDDEADENGLYGASEGVYVTSASGAVTDRFAGGSADGGAMVAFTPNVADSEFMLHWPGNEAVRLPAPTKAK